MDQAEVKTRRWVEAVIVGLPLCPFAAGPHRRGQIRYVQSRSAGVVEETLAEVWGEARRLLRDGGDAETTLLLLPEGFGDFDDLLDLCAAGEALLEAVGLGADIQLVAFHPDFCFDGAEAGEAGNETNRSPVPLLHLLRAADVAAAIAQHPDVEGIPERNAARLRALGAVAVRALWAAR